MREAVVGATEVRAQLDALARGETLLVPLDQLGVLRFEGEDAARFLHGQLTCHVEGLADRTSTYGAYCTPQGRMLASFLLLHRRGAYWMVLARGLAPTIARRLRMFVLRAKVRIEDVTAGTALFGLAGANAAATLGDIGVAPSAQDHVATESEHGSAWIRLPIDRFLGLADAGAADAVHDALLRTAQWASSEVWTALDIAAGFALVTEPTQDQLVPQMANLEHVGGVHFQKGCYPGQEIVARTQYRGKTKRRMFRGRAQTDALPAAGTAVYATDLGDQASGLVVAAAPSRETGFDVLVVAHITSAEAGALRLGALDGPAITLEPLPYALA